MSDSSYARLLAGLSEAGALDGEWWDVFARAPRSAFVPETVWAPDDESPTGYRRVTLADDADVWWSLVNADGVVVTQVDDGADGGPGLPTSSASKPSLVASMLRHLDVSGDDSVLDIGTGTGWTSALLTARLGDGAVTTVEVDPRIAAQAAGRLKTAGFAPTLVVGDGLAGWPAGAPYTRIHSTAAVRTVPRAWIEQTRPGGVIVTPWGTPYANAGLLRLTVGELGQESYGHFVDNVSFMWMRAQRPTPTTDATNAPAHQGPSAFDPDLALENVDAAFAIGLRVPDVRYVHTWDDADPAATYRIRLTDGNGSWSSARYADWQSPTAVHQAGPRLLWDEITAARRWWLTAGRPSLTRFGVTVTPEGAQRVWLDDPGARVLT